MHEGLKSYIRMLLEELHADESLEEMGAASGGGNSVGAGAVAGFTAPLGASKSPTSRRKSRRLTSKK